MLLAYKTNETDNLNYVKYLEYANYHFKRRVVIMGNENSLS